MTTAALKPGRRATGYAPLGPMLLIVVFLPALIFYLGLSSSLALGTGMAALLLVGVGWAATSAPGRSMAAPAVLVAVIAAAIGLHLVGVAMHLPLDVARAATSLIPLALVIFGGCAMGHLLASAADAKIGRAVRLTFAVLCVASVMPALGVAPGMPNVEVAYAKPVFPFTEPSHLALVFVPMLMYCSVASRRLGRIVMLLLGAGVAAGLQNLTLVVGVVLVACVCLRSLALPALAVALGLLATQLDLSYYVERLDFSGEVQNLSNLVYVQGWQLLGEALERSIGWGLGFQQLGLQGSNTAAADLIFVLLGDYANVLDGGFTFAKLGSEFGLFGLALTVVYLAYAWQAVRGLRLAARGAAPANASVVFAQCVLVSYCIELFVRGAGYFTSTGILLVAAFWILSQTTRRSSSTGAVAAGKEGAVHRVAGTAAS